MTSRPNASLLCVRAMIGFRELQVAATGFVRLLSVGSVVAVKGYDLLIAALAMLADLRGSLRLPAIERAIRPPPPNLIPTSRLQPEA